MKKHIKEKLFTSFLILFILVMLALIFIPALHGPREHLDDGSSAAPFCSLYCGSENYYSSINSTKYAFIRCDCVDGIRYGDGQYVKDAPTFTSTYFDSQSLKEIPRTLVGERIESS